MIQTLLVAAVVGLLVMLALLWTYAWREDRSE